MKIKVTFGFLITQAMPDSIFYIRLYKHGWDLDRFEINVVFNMDIIFKLIPKTIVLQFQIECDDFLFFHQRNKIFLGIFKHQAPEKELEQSKAIYIQNLKVNLEKTSFLASRAFREKLFGKDHPYGKDLEEGDVSVLQKDQLVSHYNSFYKHLTAFVSGKIDDSIETLITKSLARIKTVDVDPVKISPVVTPDFHERIVREGSVQTSIRAGKKSLLRSAPDYGRAIFTSHILGGYFGSRLMKNIREEKGLTYGIYASLHPLQHDSYLVIGADVNNENVDLTMDEIRKEIKILRTEPVSAEELDTTKNHFIGSLQAEITTPFAHADKIKTLYLHSLTSDFYQRMISTVDTITADDIMEISNKYFHEDSLNEVAVG